MVDIPTVPITTEPEEDRFESLRVERLVEHHKLLLGSLQDIADGTIQNLMVFMPPGSAKSTYVDVVFVPWFMARTPKQSVILASYGSDLARKQGRRARQLVRSKGFGSLFDATLSADSSAADEWSLTNGSEYMAGGLLSGITGNRADLAVIDDPVAGREAADSETIRKKTREAYEDDFCTRLKPHGRQVIIQTRWHADDLSGSILPEDWSGESGLIDCRDGRQWRVLCLPAQADRADDPIGRQIGDYIWPEWFGDAHWQPFKRNQRTWSALYQQKPSPEEGTFFQKAWFKRHAQKPDHLRIYASSDYAVTEDGGDWTVHRIWGVDHDYNIYLLDGWKGQKTADVWIDAKIALMVKWKPLAWFGESGVIQKAVEPMLRMRMREKQVRCRLEWLPSINDKPTRARGFQARAAMGQVSIMAGLEGDAVLDEYLRFPGGKHDDDVDCASLIGRALDEMHPAILPQRAQTNNPADLDDWGRRKPMNGWKGA